MLVWVLWQVNWDLSLDGACMQNHASGIKPCNRVISPKAHRKLIPCEASND